MTATSESPKELTVGENQHPLCPEEPGSAHEVQGVV